MANKTDMRITYRQVISNKSGASAPLFVIHFILFV